MRNANHHHYPDWMSVYLRLRQGNLALVLALQLLQIRSILVLLLFKVGDIFRALLQLLVDILDTLGYILLAFLEFLLHQDGAVQFVHLRSK